MATKRDYNFKLPEVAPVRFNKSGQTASQKCEKSLSVPEDNVRLTPEVDFSIEEMEKRVLNSRLMKNRHQQITTLEEEKTLWENFRQMELTFQRTAISHNMFLMRNLVERERAFGKMQTDMDSTKEREREMKIMDQRCDFFNAVLVKMRFEIKQHSIYETHLKRVGRHRDYPLKMIQDMQPISEPAQAIKNYLMKKQKEETSIFIEMHDHDLEFFSDRLVALIGMKNQLSTLCTRYEEAVRKSIPRNFLIDEVMNKFNRVTYETESALHVMIIIYRYVHERRKQTLKLPQLDVGLKIDYMNQSMYTWAEIQSINLKNAYRASKLMLSKQTFKKKNEKESSSDQKKNS